MRAIAPNPTSPLSISHADAGSGTGLAVMSRIVSCPAVADKPLRSIHTVLPITWNPEGKSAVDGPSVVAGSTVTEVMGGAPAKSNSNPLKPVAPYDTLNVAVQISCVPVTVTVPSKANALNTVFDVTTCVVGPPKAHVEFVHPYSPVTVTVEPTSDACAVPAKTVLLSAAIASNFGIRFEILFILVPADCSSQSLCRVRYALTSVSIYSQNCSLSPKQPQTNADTCYRFVRRL
jgi:hypothetical protein